MQGDFEKAEEYLLKAHQAEKRDFWATLDLFYLWLRNPSTNRAKFDKMFDDYVNSPWLAVNKGLMARLKLVKGNTKLSRRTVSRLFPNSASIELATTGRQPSKCE